MLYVAVNWLYICEPALEISFAGTNTLYVWIYCKLFCSMNFLHLDNKQPNIKNSCRVCNVNALVGLISITNNILILLYFKHSTARISFQSGQGKLIFVTLWNLPSIITKPCPYSCPSRHWEHLMSLYRLQLTTTTCICKYLFADVLDFSNHYDKSCDISTQNILNGMKWKVCTKKSQ